MPTPDRPNVLLICVDHWPARLLGAAGHPCIMTPTLDQLAANGVRFSNCYSPTPTCIPARRELMAGTTARTHGERVFAETQRMPALPTLAQTFTQAGYQAFAVGKLHVYPQRDRIGFDDVILHEEGRHHLGLSADDYELYLAAQGYAGQAFTHGAAMIEVMGRPWHLPEHLHPIHWTVREMCRTIQRRDPTRPAFWYMSFCAVQGPLTPPAGYLDLYADAEIPAPEIGDWAADFDRWPYALKVRGAGYPRLKPREQRLAHRALFAQCTYLDHQMRLVLGTLREEGLLDNTVVGFVSDHGVMLGDHGLHSHDVLYEDAMKVPLILVDTARYAHLGHHRVDDRLVELRDIMPTLLEMAGIPIPATVEGRSLLRVERRDHVYGEHFENERATRMLRDERFKLIYYPIGNRVQLFDLRQDPRELCDLSDDPAHAQVRAGLVDKLAEHLYGSDLAWVQDGKLVGLPERAYGPLPSRHMSSQRGWRFM